ncbi:MAG TPA: hypothetical protein VEY07_01700, partial [Thermoplasmata archaeon]|nr:hypothetical protein [Thermoplasmata archaeon]
MHPTPQRWPHRLPPPSGRVSLLRYPAANLEAFSFTLLSLAGGSRRGPHRHEVIVLSDGLLDAVTSVEVEAVV